MADDATRDRVRALVRDVLSKAAPADSQSTSATGFSNPPSAPSTKPSGSAVTRDESAKLVITEDDVRGLESGAVLRLAENARLTPLAADIVHETGLDILRPVPSTGSHHTKTAQGAADLAAPPAA